MIEFEIPYSLTTPVGVLEFNAPTTSPFDSTPSDLVYLLDPEKCSATPGPLRITVDDVPQADGSIIHPSFLHGYTVKFGLSFWIQIGDSVDAREPACGGDLRVMWDAFIYYLNALKSPSVSDLFGSNCRLVYTPSGGSMDDRMVDQLQLIEWPVAAYSSPLTTAEFTIQSALPYEMNAEQVSAPLTTTSYTVGGTSETWPVFIVNGATSAFTITHNGLGQSIIFDSSLPGATPIGGGDYVEINTFRNTAYLNGSGANEKVGIDVANSDFFPLLPGSNSLTFSGATGTILYNSAWAN